MRMQRALALAAAAIVMLAAGAFTPSAHAAPAGPHWRRPRLIDHRAPFDIDGAQLSAVSCPSRSLCVGLGGTGDVLATAHPARAGAWIPTMVDSSSTFDGTRMTGGGLSAIACTAAPLCVGVDWKGNVWTSRDPLAGYRSWKRFRLFAGDLSLDPSVSCAGGPVCAIAVGSTVYATDDPTGGAAAWTAAPTLAPGATFTGIACVAGGSCHAIDDRGEVASSADPTGGTAAWTLATGVVGDGLRGISCASAKLCAIFDFQGRVLTSTDPSGGATAWTSSPLPLADPSGSLSGISCPSATLCVVVAWPGDVFVSHAPTAGGPAWHRVRLPGADPPTYAGFGVACAPNGACLLPGGGGAVLGNLAAGRVRWSVVALGTDTLDSISCPAAGRCVATGGGDRIFTTTRGSGPSPGWRFHGHPAVSGTLSVACPSLGLCVAAGARGEVLASRQPFTGRGSWRLTVRGSPGVKAGSAIACPSTSLCVSVHGGRASVTRQPAGGAARWRSSIVDHGRYGCSGLYGRGLCAIANLISLSCPSASLCVAGDNDGGVLVSRDPAGGARTWRRQRVVPGPVRITSISCVRRSGCLAADSAGDLLRSPHPAAPSATWTTTRLEPAGTVDSVDCMSATRCVAVDDLGRLLHTSDPWAPAPAWTYRRIDGMSPLTSVSCSSPAFCGAVDGLGYATLTR